MVYRGTRGFLPFLGSRRGSGRPWRGPDRLRGPRMAPLPGPAGRQAGAGAAPGRRRAPGRAPDGGWTRQVPWCRLRTLEAKCVKRAKNDHFWSILTIFGFKMRFFIFERFVNPARDAFPSCVLCLSYSPSERSRSTTPRSRRSVAKKSQTRNSLIVPWENYSL